jgi:D-serine deaminase-like pyridoxal phosphate-dependent protein
MNSVASDVIGQTADGIDTPAVVIDRDILERNIRRLADYLAQHGLASRPHIKSHKIPEIARAQMAAGSVGITCQKLGEAEVMVDAGLTDILIPMNILGEPKIWRLIALMRRARISVTTDNLIVAQSLSGAACEAGFILPVLVECDTGQGRCGVQSPAAAAELAQEIARLPGLRFDGLLTFPTSRTAGEFMVAATRLLSDQSLAPSVVSGGGTPGVWHSHEIPGFTEHRAGEYVFNDRNIIAAGEAQPEDCALRVRATVVSRPTADRAILDSGSKTLSSNPGRGITGFGLIVEYPEAQVVRLTEEHGIVDLRQCRRKPDIGESITIIPNHASQVMNLHDVAYGMRGWSVEVAWPIRARGCVR